MICTRIDPPIPLDTDKGYGLAHFLINYGAEQEIVWVVFLENREVWEIQNHNIRACKNYTMERE